MVNVKVSLLKLTRSQKALIYSILYTPFTGINQMNVCNAKLWHYITLRHKHFNSDSLAMN